MTTVGIVGGLGPESTIDYYRRILEAWERNDSSTAPSIVIDSLDVRRALHLSEPTGPHSPNTSFHHCAGSLAPGWTSPR